MFEIRHLRAFRAIAEELHFGKAARRLNMTQPPLSQLLKQLEVDIGEKLLNRTTRSVELTPAGRAFLTSTCAIIDAAEAAPRVARRVALGETGRLTIGFVSSAAYVFLPQMIHAFRFAFPEVELSFKEMLSTRQIDELRKSIIDIGLVRRLAPGSDLDARVVWRESFVVAVPLLHPLSCKEAIHVHELNGQPFITFGPDDSPYFSEKVEKLMSQHNARPVVVQRAALHTILAFVEAGIGIALVPESASSMSLTNTRFIKLAGAKPKDAIEITAVWLKGEQPVLVRNWLSAVAPIYKS